MEKKETRRNQMNEEEKEKRELGQQQQSQFSDHEFCLRCGRKLKNALARERGYGVICYKKNASAGNRPLFSPHL